MAAAIILPRIRLFTGLVLMAFVAGHLLNSCAGLLSIGAMDASRAILLRPWQSWPGQALLYGSLLVHLALGLFTLFSRVRLAPSALDVAQIIAGLAIPLLMLAHVVATRGVRLLADFNPDYGWILAIYWRYAPFYGFEQVLLVAFVWVHGCIGLLSWLRLRPWWPKVSAFVYPPVFALPIVALFGFVRGGDEALMRLDSEEAFAQATQQRSETAYSFAPTLSSWQSSLTVTFLILACVALLPTVARLLERRFDRRRVARLAYVDGPTVDAPVGSTILDISRRHAISHSSICSGRARCGTCRVRVDGPAGALSPAGAEELARLEKVGAGPDVRLACRAAIVLPVELVVERLVPVEEAEAVAQGGVLEAEDTVDTVP